MVGNTAISGSVSIDRGARFCGPKSARTTRAETLDGTQTVAPLRPHICERVRPDPVTDQPRVRVGYWWVQAERSWLGFGSPGDPPGPFSWSRNLRL